MALPRTQAALEESFVNVMHDDQCTYTNELALILCSKSC